MPETPNPLPLDTPARGLQQIDQAAYDAWVLANKITFTIIDGAQSGINQLLNPLTTPEYLAAKAQQDAIIAAKALATTQPPETQPPEVNLAVPPSTPIQDIPPTTTTILLPPTPVIIATVAQPDFTATPLTPSAGDITFDWLLSHPGPVAASIQAIHATANLQVVVIKNGVRQPPVSVVTAGNSSILEIAV